MAENYEIKKNINTALQINIIPLLVKLKNH